MLIKTTPYGQFDGIILFHREVWSVSIQATDISNNEVKEVDNIPWKQFVPSFCTLIKEYLAPIYQDGISFDIKLIKSNEIDRR